MHVVAPAIRLTPQFPHSRVVRSSAETSQQIGQPTRHRLPRRILGSHSTPQMLVLSTMKRPNERAMLAPLPRLQALRLCCLQPNGKTPVAGGQPLELWLLKLLLRCFKLPPSQLPLLLLKVSMLPGREVAGGGEVEVAGAGARPNAAIASSTS